MLSKQALRGQLLAHRRSLPAEICLERSQRIGAMLSEFPPVRSARHIAAYFPTQNEPDLSFLWQRFPEKTWYFPACQGQKLGWFQVDVHNWQAETTIGKYGIRTPLPHLPPVDLPQIEVVLVPMVAGTRAGDRLGYGGGYYDRSLVGFQGWRIGVLYGEFLIPTLPVSVWDVQMQVICTETELIIVERREGDLNPRGLLHPT